ncbi:hypothetical protein [Halosegnis marinus]|uniref:Uncharacterized protein n=1 Tax=Halosegnis marinus TaxID=3034023 RepID=A0ABD5ZL37_9EURY|nr:hypothetical protein [Halosegnis sp. DT85]
MRVTRTSALLSAALAAVGAALLAVPFLAALFGVARPPWAATASGSGRVLAGASLAVVAAWFARERDGPAGFTALLGALLGAVAGVAAAVLSPAALDGVARIAAAMMQFTATGVFFLAVGLAANDDRLTTGAENAAAVVGLLCVAAALFPFVRPLALLGWCGWCGWLAARLARTRN